MKTLIAAAMTAALIVPAAASANEGNPQNCEANPQQPFCSGTVTVDQPTTTECPNGGLVLVVDSVRYPVCNGTNGTDGIDGSAGANGTNGVDGLTGMNGTNGADGTDGAPGSPGVATPAPPVVTTVYRFVSSPRRPQRCERRFNKHGKLVVVCKRTTCPRREGGKKNRRLVAVCRPKGKK